MISILRIYTEVSSLSVEPVHHGIRWGAKGCGTVKMEVRGRQWRAPEGMALGKAVWRRGTVPHAIETRATVRMSL